MQIRVPHQVYFSGGHPQGPQARTICSLHMGKAGMSSWLRHQDPCHSEVKNTPPYLLETELFFTTPILRTTCKHSILLTSLTLPLIVHCKLSTHIIPYAANGCTQPHPDAHTTVPLPNMIFQLTMIYLTDFISAHSPS